MSEHHPCLPQRRSGRLRTHDYLHGQYFITICTDDRKCLLGHIEDDTFAPSPLGRIVSEEWARMLAQRPNVQGDAMVVMPNHLHGILQLVHATDSLPGTHPRDAPRTRSGGPLRASLGAIVGGLKAAVTRRARGELGIVKVWQSHFFDRVIRSQRGLDALRQYIGENPQNWAKDCENPRLGARHSSVESILLALDSEPDPTPES